MKVQPNQLKPSTKAAPSAATNNQQNVKAYLQRDDEDVEDIDNNLFRLFVLRKGATTLLISYSL